MVVIPISEFGIKIKNIEAGTLFEYNLGVREHYECKDAMFVNSLFTDFLLDNGLKVVNGTTRDIICLEFNLGSRSYQKELKHLHKVMNNCRHDYIKAKSKKDEYLINKAKCKKDTVNELLHTAYKNQNKYKKVSKEDIRTLFYNEGVNIEYINYYKDGSVRSRKTLHYKMLYRSTGKAKKGTCMFIVDRLYKKAYDFLYMGIKLNKTNAPIVEASAYIPLISSGIVGRIHIDPKEILVLKEVDRYFTTNVISVETDENKHCIAKKINDYTLHNAMFDGQALIDSSIFPDWGNGYILLRHHFCKMAAFNSNIQLFFKDYFGDKYETATVTDMFGNEHYIKDIKLITTDNALKFLKFDVSYDYWCDKVRENGSTFGIVKTAHESKLGSFQKMSYQMVNSLSYDQMEDVCKETINMLENLKKDNNAFLNYLKMHDNFSNDYQVLIDLCKHNPEFHRSEYFRRRKSSIIYQEMFNVKTGELIQNAENLTIVGSPYAMLLYGATGNPDDVDKDISFSFEEGTIQCYSERFDDGEYLAGFRSPFNGKYNMSYLHNIRSEQISKYFNLGRQVIAVNMNGTDFQDRNNGADQDSDFMYTTNQKSIVECAKYCYENYPTIVNNIPKDKNVYNNTMDDFAKVDNLLSASQTDIGESSNLAQLAQTYTYNFDDEKYKDYVAILSVVAQIAIDNSKRRFDIDISEEIKRIKKDMDIKNNKYPIFWTSIKKDFNKSNINYDLKCPMNYVHFIKVREFRSKEPELPMSYFFKKYPWNGTHRKNKRIENMIIKFSFNIGSNYYQKDERISKDEYFLLRSDFQEIVDELKTIQISKSCIGLTSWLIDRAFVITDRLKYNSPGMKTLLNRNKSALLKILYCSNPKNVLEVLSKNMS